MLLDVGTREFRKYPQSSPYDSWEVFRARWKLTDVITAIERAK
jgi:hypothetical protein